MSQLGNITQSHLSVLFADSTANNPIKRMPVYGEIAISETVGKYTIDPADFPFHLEPDVQARILDAFARLMAKDDFQALKQSQKDELHNKIVGLVTDAGLMGPQRRSEKEVQIEIDEIVKKALSEIDISYAAPEWKKVLRAHPLGYIATDHVGYASFDLRNFHKTTLLDLSTIPGATEYSFYVYPMGKEELRLDVLAQARVTKDAVFAKFAINPPLVLPDMKAINLPSMQNPSLVDWYFSPGSFAAKPDFLVGEDGCETLMPAQLALSQFNFRQVVRVSGVPTEADGWPNDIGPLPSDAKYAFVDEYQASWYALGHSLGEIQYSLPLAPGESVKLAVIDWSWDSLTSRDEKTKFTEEVLHQTHRDRTISETVKAAVDEWQRGGNIQAGIAGGSGAAGSAGGKGFSSGNAWSLGGGYSTSSGSRNLAAENVQRLGDSFVQASSAQRELNSTVVIQARQEEKESIQTRTFTNYNHSHTLTILYYEVLRHFKMEVEWLKRRPAVLVPVTPLDFSKISNSQLLTYRNRLEESLLDQRFKVGFSIVEELDTEEKFQDQNPPKTPAPPFWEGDTEFTLFEIGVRNANDNQTSQLVMVNLITTNGDAVGRPLLQTWDKGTPTNNLNVGERFNYKNTWNWFIVRPIDPTKKFTWHEIAGFEFVLHDDDDWQISGLTINAFHAGNSGGKTVLLPMKEDANYYFANNSSSNTITYIERPKGNRETAPEPQKKPIQTLSKEKLQQYQSLRNHLIENAAYYQRQVYLRNPIEATQIHFDSRPWSPSSTYADHAHPTPLEMFGNYIAFPLLSNGKVTIPKNDPSLERKAERLATLPTRGVFAEGKLGHCNISEEIDNTRFWKWDEHPIPVQAPDISPIQAVTPQPQDVNIAAGAFPAALLSIVNPTPAPDPHGLSDALKLMATSNIFRDMSGRTETTDLLKKLSDNSVRFAEIAEKALNPVGASGGSSSGGTSSGSTGSGAGGSGSGSATDTTKTGSAQTTSSDRINAAKNAMQIADQMSPANKKTVESAAKDAIISTLSDTKTSPDEDAKKAASALAKQQFSKEFIDRIDPGSMTIFDAYFELPVGSYGRQVIEQVSALLRAGSLRGIVRSDNLPFLDGRLTVQQQTTLRNAASNTGNNAFAFFQPFDVPSLFSPVGAIVFVRNLTITPTHPKADLGFQINAIDFSDDSRINEWRGTMAHEIVHAINPVAQFFPNGLTATPNIWADQTLLAGSQLDVETLRNFTGEITGRYVNWLVWQNILGQSEAVLPNEVFLATREFIKNYAANSDAPSVPLNPLTEPLYDTSRYMRRLVAKANAKVVPADASLINKQASLWLRLISQHFSLLYPEPTSRMQKLFSDASITTGESTSWAAPSGVPRGLHSFT
jgi:uncharacterized membrane protein YgcG